MTLKQVVAMATFYLSRAHPFLLYLELKSVVSTSTFTSLFKHEYLYFCLSEGSVLPSLAIYTFAISGYILVKLESYNSKNVLNVYL